MQERHHNRRQYFDEQVLTTRAHVLPYIRQTMEVAATTRVLEIGCGEGGNLVPFLELGCQGVGVDLSQTKIDLGKQYLTETLPRADLRLPSLADALWWSSANM